MFTIIFQLSMLCFLSTSNSMLPLLFLLFQLLLLISLALPLSLSRLRRHHLLHIVDVGEAHVRRPARHLLQHAWRRAGAQLLVRGGRAAEEVSGHVNVG